MSQGTRRCSEHGIALGALLLIAAPAIAAGCDPRIGDAGAAVDAGSQPVADAGGFDPLRDAAAQESPPDASPDAPPPDARLPCDQGDARVEDTASGACYMFFGESLSWAEAQAACAGLGGHLATATSQLENSVASQIAPADDIWFGATDTGSEGDFAWVTSEPFVFTHWRRGEPNDGGDDGEDCAVLEGDNNLPGLGCLWDDRPCEDGHPYMCERP